jgi:hypothetical protein
MEPYAEVKDAALKRPRAVEIMALLKNMRLNRIRDSRLVVQMGGLAMSKFSGSLGDEQWTIYEQVGRGVYLELMMVTLGARM